MQVQIDIGFEQLIKIIRRLPSTQLTKLKAEIEKGSSMRTETNDWVSFLAKAPTFTKQQIDSIAETRTKLSQWREK